MSRFINIYINMGNARKSYNMKRRKYMLYSKLCPILLLIMHPPIIHHSCFLLKHWFMLNKLEEQVALILGSKQWIGEKYINFPWRNNFPLKLNWRISSISIANNLRMWWIYISMQSNFAPVEEIGQITNILRIEGAIPEDFPEGVYIRNGNSLSLLTITN